MDAGADPTTARPGGGATLVTDAAQDPVSVRLLPAADAAPAAAIWRDLEQRWADGALTSSWEWTGTWLRHYGDLVPHRFAVGERGGEPRGIVLLTEGVGRRIGPFRLRSLHLGTAGGPADEGVYVEYNRLLADPGEREAFGRGLIEAIRREPHWDELALDGFAPEDAEVLLRSEPSLRAERAACPVADLAAARDSGADVLETLRSGTRQRVRRSLRGFGEVETEWAETDEQALDILEELIELHQRRWTDAGRPGAFSSGRFRGFHAELVPLLLRRRAVMLFRARSAAGTIGCLYGFVERRRLLFYQSGLGSFADSKLKPGLVAHALCMQACLERGLDAYDFLAGESRYKRELSSREDHLVWATARRRRLKFALVERLRRLRAATRRGGAPMRR